MGAGRASLLPGHVFCELKSVSTEPRSALALQAKYSDDGDSEDGDADGDSEDGDADDNNGDNDCRDDSDSSQGVRRRQ